MYHRYGEIIGLFWCCHTLSPAITCLGYVMALAMCKLLYMIWFLSVFLSFSLSISSCTCIPVCYYSQSLSVSGPLKQYRPFFSSTGSVLPDPLLSLTPACRLTFCVYYQVSPLLQWIILSGYYQFVTHKRMCFFFAVVFSQDFVHHSALKIFLVTVASGLLYGDPNLHLDACRIYLNISVNFNV